MTAAPADRIVAGADVLVRAVGDESVLLNLTTETYFGLDPIGTRMWQLLIASDSIQAACVVLLAEYDVAPDDLERDLDVFITELIARRLVSVAPGG